jgi:hypothetical protein
MFHQRQWCRLGGGQTRLYLAESAAAVVEVKSDLAGRMKASGAWALWGLIIDLHRVTNSLPGASADPVAYAT